MKTCCSPSLFLFHPQIYEFHSDVGAAAHESDASSSETDLQSKKNCDEEPRTLRVFTEETVPCPDTTHGNKTLHRNLMPIAIFHWKASGNDVRITAGLV